MTWAPGAKREMRARMREVVRALDPADAGEAVELGLGELEASAGWTGARTVLGYLGDEFEPSLDALLARAIAGGKAVVAPRMDWDARTMDARRLASLDEVEVRRHGIREPLDSCDVVEVASIDLALVPGLAFDRRGGRLGRGAGYYDRFLKGLTGRARRVGICFAAQLVEQVPTEAHDARMDGLVAGEVFMLFGRGGGSEA